MSEEMALTRESLDRLAATLVLSDWQIQQRWEPAEVPADTNPVVLVASKGHAILEIMRDGQWLMYLELGSGFDAVTDVPQVLNDVSIQFNYIGDEDEFFEEDEDDEGDNEDEY